MLMPINLRQWIDENRASFKPPVGNRQIWADRDFMVTLVGGPNSRTDFHVNQTEEFFYQLEGDVKLIVIENGKPVDIPLREGDVLLLPPGVPHSPQRGAGTLGMVIERRRPEGVKDGFLWFCPKCGEKLYEEFLVVKDLVRDLPPVFDRFYGNAAHCTCKKCGAKVTKS